jgi:hypothetical protein
MSMRAHLRRASAFQEIEVMIFARGHRHHHRLGVSRPGDLIDRWRP